MRCFPVLLAGLLTASVASANPIEGTQTPWATGGELPIIGGTQAAVGEFPTVVAITAGGGICTGTLVDREWVLTAAHCVDKGLLGFSTQDQVTSSVRVYYHTVNINTSAGRTNMRRASVTIPKPTFNINALGANDIGLIKLSSPIDTDPTGKPIVPSPVNLEAAMAPSNITVTQVGFGATAQGGGGTVGVMFKLANRTGTTCESFGAGSSLNLLCFNQQDSKGKCQGDSGGPSFAMIGGKPTVVGVTSFGDQNCAAFGADTRTNVEKDFLLMYAPLGPKCVMDSECPNNGICFQGQCMAQPFEGNGLGAECVDGANCESNLCADGPGGMKCTMTCTKGDDNSCPSGFECIDAGTTGVCWASSDSGCCDASGRGGPTAMLAFVLIAIAWRRKKR